MTIHDLNTKSMYNIIPLILILVSLAVIIFIVARKFSKLAILDTETMPEEKAAQAKKNILNERMKRKFSSLKSNFTQIVSPWSKKVKERSQEVKEKLEDVKKKVDKPGEEKVFVTKEEFESLDTKIQEMLAEAEGLVKEGEYDEAEKKFIDIIELDKKNILAYDGLAEVYSLKKDYPFAIETYQFVIKLNPKNDAAFSDLGDVYRIKEQYEPALDAFLKATEIAPNNPKYLDRVIELALQLNKRMLAEKFIDKLVEANPENTKIDEYKAKIKEL